MAVSKQTVLTALATFKGLQDTANEGKFAPLGGFSTVQAKVSGIAEGAQVNVLESVSVDGTALTITNKGVNIDLSGKVDAVAGKQLSTEDYTTAEQTKLAGVAEGAQVNVIESITIDGTTQTITNKGVALDLSAYVKGTDVASALRYKSSVNAASNLPASGQQIGDVYNIRTAGGTDGDGVAIKAGDNVVWNGTGWDVLAGTVDLSNYALKSEIQAVSGSAITGISVDSTPLSITNNTVNIDLSGKVDVVAGKQLSTEDFTTELKEKLDAITDENITTQEVQAIFNS